MQGGREGISRIGMQGRREGIDVCHMHTDSRPLSVCVNEYSPIFYCIEYTHMIHSSLERERGGA